MGSEDVTVAAPCILERASATACSMHNLWTYRSRSPYG